MSRSGVYFQLFYHFVWGTKNRMDLISPEVKALLIPYISGKCVDLDYKLFAVNCMPDHIHVLLGLKPTITVASVAKNLKGASSYYINNLSGIETALYWQDGYGVVTIRQAEIPGVVNYFRDQKIHHADQELIMEFEQSGSAGG
jgi:putative transposase